MSPYGCFMGESTNRGGGRIWVRILGAVVLAAVIFAFGWAAKTVFLPPDDVLVESDFTTVRATDGSIESVLNLSASASFSLNKTGVNKAAGTVTSIQQLSGNVSSGTEIYSVDLRPTVLGEGAIPSFRDLSRGSEGPDVQQLNSLLSDMGFYGGVVDDTFEEGTEKAVLRWQKESGLPEDGLVRAGDVLYVPDLPAQLVLDPEVLYLGASLTGGENFVSTSAPVPAFEIVTTPTQSASIPDGANVVLVHGDQTWAAVVSGRESAATTDNPTEDMRLQLASTSDAPICLEACSSLPVNSVTPIDASITLQAEVAGIVVPLAALRSIDDQSAAVVAEDGTVHKVEVLASAQGRVVVAGIEADTSLRVPYEEDDANR